MKGLFKSEFMKQKELVPTCPKIMAIIVKKNHCYICKFPLLKQNNTYIELDLHLKLLQE